MKEQPVLFIVIPCYNEEAVLPITSDLFLEQLMKMIRKEEVAVSSRILFVDDGSRDATWDIIRDLAKKDPHFIGIRQSRNRGHQNAVLAGLMEAKDYADITISIDADGQDDIGVMTEMVRSYKNGNEIVYGVRSDRSSDSFFKRFTAETFYKWMKKLGSEAVYNHADYRLVSSRVLRSFSDFKEVNLFLRGMFPLVGYKSATVSYERHERLAGESHYPLRKMLELAFNGITSTSTALLTWIAPCGAVLFAAGVIGLVIALIKGAVARNMPGLALLLFVMLALGGLILLAIGLVAIYLGKTYLETKERPRYIISERTYRKSTAKREDH